MKTLQHSIFICLATFIIGFVVQVDGFAQTIKDPKVNKTKIKDSNLSNQQIKDVQIDKGLIIQQNDIPLFDRVPVNRTEVDLSRAHATANLQSNNFLKLDNLNLVPSQVNGTLTPRDPYLSNNAYLEFLNGDVITSRNQVDCACGSGGLTYVKLVLRGISGKRYLITTNVSPKYDAFGLDLFTSGYIHRAAVNNPNHNVDIVLSPASTGTIELWLQCNDPNGRKRPWKFNSMKIQEIE